LEGQSKRKDKEKSYRSRSYPSHNAKPPRYPNYPDQSKYPGKEIKDIQSIKEGKRKERYFYWCDDPYKRLFGAEFTRTLFKARPTTHLLRLQE